MNMLSNCIANQKAEAHLKRVTLNRAKSLS